MVLSISLNFARLDRSSLVDDEATYAVIAQNTLSSGIWYPLLYRGGRYTNKPPLVVWPVAVAFKLFGIGEFSARLPSAIAGVITIALIYAFGLMVLGRGWALVPALLLASSVPWLTMHGVRSGASDSMLCLLMLLSVVLYLRFRLVGKVSSYYFAGAAVALCALCKGLYVPTVFLVTATIWEFVLARSGAANLSGVGSIGKPLDADAYSWFPRLVQTRGAHRSLQLPMFLYISTAFIYALWMADNFFNVPDFMGKFAAQNFIRHTRGIVPGQLNHGLDYYPKVLVDAFGYWLLAIIPFVFKLFSGRHQNTPQDRVLWFAAIWALVVLVSISCSASKSSWYLFPAFPAIAILLGAGVRELALRLSAQRVSLMGVCVCIVGIGLGLRAASVWQVVTKPGRKVEMHVARDLIENIPEARLYVGIFEKGAKIRPWNIFYASSGVPVMLVSRSELETGCNIVLTDKSQFFGQYKGYDQSRVAKLKKTLETDQDLSLVDLCGGKFHEQFRQLQNS